jgi:hypothetical protein
MGFTSGFKGLNFLQFTRETGKDKYIQNFKVETGEKEADMKTWLDPHERIILKLILKT